MKNFMLLLFFLGTISPAFSQEMEGGWIASDKTCTFWYPYDVGGITGTWSGTCSADGKITGAGMLTVSNTNDAGQPTPYIKFVGMWSEGILNGKASAFVYDEAKKDFKVYYEGNYKDALRDGLGKYYYYEAGAVNYYEGEWQAGQRQGKGAYHLAGGEFFECSWVDNKPSGILTFKFPSGDYYKGEQANATWQGKGTYYKTDGTKYDGEWKAGDLWNGFEILADGTKNEYINGSPGGGDETAPETAHAADASVSDQAADRSLFNRKRNTNQRDDAADFMNDNAEANAARIEELRMKAINDEKARILEEAKSNDGYWAVSPKNKCKVWLATEPEPGTTYAWTGKVVSGVAAGPGILIHYKVNEFDLDKPITYAKTEGTVTNGKFTGRVKESLANEETKKFDLVFDGNYSEGYRHGAGKSYEANGTFTGEYYYNHSFGEGVYAYSGGDIYEGSLAKGMRDGKGKLTGADGSSYEGIWSKDKISGVVTIRYADGSTYAGNYTNNKFNGQGVLTRTDGGRLVGTWGNGKMINGEEFDASGKAKLKYVQGEAKEKGRGWRTVGTIFAVAAAVTVTAIAIDAATEGSPSNTNRNAVNSSSNRTSSSPSNRTSSSATSRSTKSIKVINGCSTTVKDLRMSKTNTTDWEEDILGDYVLPAGASEYITFPCGTYDVLITTTSGKEYQRPAVNVCSGTQYTLKCSNY